MPRRQDTFLDDVADWLAAFDAWAPKTRDWVDLVSETVEGIREVAKLQPGFKAAYRAHLAHHKGVASEYPDREED